MSLLENRSVGQQFLAEDDGKPLNGILEIYHANGSKSRYPIMNGAKGVSGNTVSDLREVAIVWDKSAEYCDILGEPELADRDRRFAAAMREAASILEALKYDP